MSSPLLDVRVDQITRLQILDALLGIDATPTRERVQKNIRAIMGHAVLREWRFDNPADDALRAALSTGKRQPAEAPRRATLRRGSTRAGQGRRTRRLAVRGAGIAVRGIDRHQKRRGSRRALGRVRPRRSDMARPRCERMKAGRPFDVPLSIPALNVLRRAEELADGSGYVFPSTLGKPMSDARLSEMMRACAGSTVHGLRL